MRVKIYIEDNLIDLFESENLEINSSVADTQDISKTSTDYTRTFTVPASDNNNAIFKHYYNADIDNTFDARTKKKARIEIDGFPFRTGKMRLEKVSMERGKASSYTINFWGNLINFKTILKDDTLNMLDLSAYDHNYSYSSVIAGLTNGMFDKDIIYNLMEQKRQYMYSSDPGNNTNTDKLVNIAYNGAARGVIWSDLKPSIRLLALIEAIEAKYNISFSRDFFNRNEFKELYMWLNNSEGTQYTEQLINWDPEVMPVGQDPPEWLNYDTDTLTIGAAQHNLFRYWIKITPTSGYGTVPYKIIVRNNDFTEVSLDAVGTVNTGLLALPDGAVNLKFYVSSSATFTFHAMLMVRYLGYDSDYFRYAYNSPQTITDIFNVAPALPKLKTIDFLKGLFNMFKLVAIPDDQGNIYVNNINDYYREGNLYDITRYIDYEKTDVERGKLFNNIDFKFQEPTTILAAQFKKNTGEGYGDEKLTLTDEEGEPLDGDPLEIALPFEQVYFERLIDINVNEPTAIQYGLITDESISPANPKAVIFYNNRVSFAENPVSLMNELGEWNMLIGIVNTPHHGLGLSSPNFTILWGAEFSVWDYAIMNNTLYKNYWSEYISSIFNIKRRNFKFNAILPTRLLTRIKLNDVLRIKDRYYRINDFTVNLLTGETSLTLMNSFEANFGLFLPEKDSVLLSFLPQSYGVYVSNGSVMNISKQDIGFGVDWYTATQSGNNIIIEVTENTGDVTRSSFINVDNGAGKSFQILLSQDEEQ